MVYLESFCAALFTTVSAALLVNIKLRGSADNVFLNCLLLTCLTASIALWRVEGRHACWHGGSPWKGAGASTAGGAPPAPMKERMQQATESDTSSAACGNVLSEAAESNELPLVEDFPLERRSSFVDLAMRIHG